MAPPDSVNDDVVRFHDEATVIDGLIPTLTYLDDEDYLDNLRQGGITAANFTFAINDDFLTTTKRIQRYQRQIEEHPDLVMVRSTSDIDRASQQDAIGVIFGFQDTEPVGRDRDAIRAFSQMGVRVIQLTYHWQNYVGSGCWEAVDTGLTYFGRDIIDECNRHGILIDLSHCGDTTTTETIAYSDDPVAFTHVASRELGHAEGRGKTADQMRAVAENDGVIGITCHPPYLRRDPQTHHVEDATIEDVMDHIDYVADLVGPEYVSLGTDLMDKAWDMDVSPSQELFDDRYIERLSQHPEVFGANYPDGDVTPPDGLERHTQFPNLTQGLLNRGYSRSEVSGILGGNFYRVCGNVWE